jgi:hypothetical protein
MSDHTPGPWYANGDCVEAAGEEGPRDRTLAVVHGTEREANARLIAAAPELLAALKAHIPWKDAGLPKKPPQGWGIWQDAIDAINKAEGRGE